MKTVVVINKNSGRTKKHAKAIKDFYVKNGVQVFEIEGSEAFDKTIKAALKQKPARFIVCGGDGTVICAIEHAINNDVDCSFGIVPTGTVNYLARNAKVSLDIRKACQQSLSNKTTDVYLAKANKKMFAVGLKIGVMAETVHTTSDNLKRRLGQASYLVSALRSARTHSKFEYHIKHTDGGLDGFSHQILVVNAKLNNAMSIAPDASMEDQDLKLVIYKAQNMFSLTLSVLAYVLSFGRIHSSIIELTGRSFDIRTELPRKVALDGDVRMDTPVTVSSNNIPVAVAH